MRIHRQVLERLYESSAIAGAVMFVGICAVILAQIVGRLLGVYIPESDDITAWCVAGATFLPLAHIYRRGAHIRVTLLADQIKSPLMRSAADLLVLVVGLAVSGIFVAAGVDLIRDSFAFQETSAGELGVPMWIPQTSMCLGSAVLFAAILDDIVSIVAGRAVSWRAVAPQDALEQAAEDL